MLCHWFFVDHPHPTAKAWATHYFIRRVPTIPDVPIHHQLPASPTKEPVIYYGALPETFALFLYSGKVSRHITFMEDVSIANHGHSITIYKHDCTQLPVVCEERGHAGVHEYDPPIMFYQNTQWTESFHDEQHIKGNARHVNAMQPHAMQPHGSLFSGVSRNRAQRVKAVVQWLDQAAPAAMDKIYKMHARKARGKDRVEL